MNKKIIIALCAIGLLASSCQEQMTAPSELGGAKKIKVTAIAEGDVTTRTTETDGRFAWSQGDAIAIWTKSGAEYSFTELANEQAGATAIFEGIIEVDEPVFESFAIYPAGDHTIAAAALSINLPAVYGDINTELGNNINSPMVAEIATPIDPLAAEDVKLNFKHACGVIRLTINNVPAGTDEFVFVAEKDITGQFAYDAAAKQITQGEANTGLNTVTIKFKAANTKTSRVFYIPLPVGDYSNFSIQLIKQGTLLKNLNLKGKSLSRATLATKSITMTAISGEIEGEQPEARNIATAAELADYLAECAAAGAGDSVINITQDITLNPGEEWTPLHINGYGGAGVITINGNGHFIAGLSAPLISSGFAGNSGFIVNNLTIKNSTIAWDDEKEDYVGAFFGQCDAMPCLEFRNCALENVTINSDKYIGGFVAWTSGWDKEGPVETKVVIDGCSVTNCVFNSTSGSVGGFIGHAGANPNTINIVRNSTISGTQFNSKGAQYIGYAIGTVNVGKSTVIENVSASGCTYTVNNADQAALTKPVGRLALGEDGHLTIDGVEVTSL